MSRKPEIEALLFDNSIPFEEKTLKIFHYQYDHVRIYHSFCKQLGIQKENISELRDIPFLPIELFKTHTILSEGLEAEKVFSSSGTTGQNNSRHYVASLNLYERSILNGFVREKGNPEEYVIIGLLPSYLERDDASLVYMVNFLMKKSGHSENGFYLDDFKGLANVLRKLEHQKQKTLLIGVTFALLDLAEQFPMPLKYTSIIETGGMKGRRKEMTREELHAILKSAFPGVTLSSEYGMTELLSQGYLKNDGRFHPSSTLKVFTREINDPFSFTSSGETGALNIIDLSNLYSCAFIATQDLGKVYDNGTFEVLGRMDNSDLRGCNLMVD